MSISIGSPINIDSETSNNSWTNIYAGPVAPGDVVALQVSCMARKASNGDCAFWEKRALFRRDDTDPLVLIGSVLDLTNPIKTLGAALWDFRLRSDNDDYFYIDVKGASGADVGWYVFGDGVILDYPA